MLERTTPLTSASISSEWLKLGCTHILGVPPIACDRQSIRCPPRPGPVCVDASSSLEPKKLAAYKRLIAYPRRAEPKMFEDHGARLCRKKRSASPRSCDYVEPQFDPYPLQSLLTPLCVSCISIRWYHTSSDYCEDGRILKARHKA